MRWPTLTEWGLIVLMLLVFFVLLFMGLTEVLARRDVKQTKRARQKADR